MPANVACPACRWNRGRRRRGTRTTANVTLTCLLSVSDQKLLPMCSGKVPLLYTYPLLFPAVLWLNVNEAQPQSKQERRSRSCGLRTWPFLPKQPCALFLTRVLTHELGMVHLPCGALDETDSDGRAWLPLRTRSEIMIDPHRQRHHCHQRVSEHERLQFQFRNSGKAYL